MDHVGGLIEWFEVDPHNAIVSHAPGQPHE
jgi:hypothetical protein